MPLGFPTNLSSFHASHTLKAYPDGAKEKDAHGRIPLHMGMKCSAPVEVIRVLVEAWPHSIKERGPSSGFADAHVCSRRLHLHLSGDDSLNLNVLLTFLPGVLVHMARRRYPPRSTRPHNDAHRDGEQSTG
jgi:hypothetical protein